MTHDYANMSMIWAITGIDSHEKLILLFIGYRSNGSSFSQIRHEEICVATRLSLRTVIRKLATIEAKGYVEVKREKIGCANLYRVSI